MVSLGSSDSILRDEARAITGGWIDRFDSGDSTLNDIGEMGAPLIGGGIPVTNATSDTDPIPVAAVVRRPGEGRQIPLSSVVLKAEGRHSGGTVTVYEATLGPRMAGPAVHIHPTGDEAFYILAGEMTFQVGDATHALPAGSFVFVPHGVAHTFWNAGLEPARQLTFFTPSGIEDVFEARAALQAEGGEASIEAVTALNTARARLGTIFLPSDRTPFGPLD
jgi:quercetin dioxygenase-like cupin family protein